MIILNLNKENQKDVVRICAKSLKQGKVLVFPTDTVYGLLADATNQKAVNKVFKIKERLKSKPLPIFIKSLAVAKSIAKINKEQGEFLKDAWPGKITAILFPQKELAKGIGITKKEIGLRVSDYEPLSELLRLIKTPLAQTSANLSGEPASTKIKDILQQFNSVKQKPDLIISAGNLPKNKSSKIVNLTFYPYDIVRL